MACTHIPIPVLFSLGNWNLISSLCLALKSASISWFANGSLPLEFILLGISTVATQQVSGNDARVIPFVYCFCDYYAANYSFGFSNLNALPAMP